MKIPVFVLTLVLISKIFSMPLAQGDHKQEMNDDMPHEIAEIAISRDYNLGQNLIYDCELQSYICVNEESFSFCQQQAYCHSIKIFQNFQDCRKAQLKMIHAAHRPEFCGEI